MAYSVTTKKRRAVSAGGVETIPPGKVTDEFHGELIKWINDADDATLYTQNLAKKSRSYYDSEQWTDEEKAKLAAQSQAATVSNRIKPKMDGLMGMEKSNRTTAKAYARTPKHQQAATACTEAIRFVLDDQFYHQKRSSAWENLLIEGTCGVEVSVKAKGDDYKIILNHLMWDRLIYDPHARRKDFSDAMWLGQVIWMDYDAALTMYPDGKSVLDTMLDGSSTYDDKPRWMDGNRRRVKIVEIYYIKGRDFHYCVLTRGGYLKAPSISPYVNEEGETEWPYEFASMFVDMEGGRYGASKQLLDIQDEVNKRRSKSLHLMSVRQIRLERGAVEDVDKTRKELAKPDGVVETTPGMEFEILKTGDMAAGQFNLLAEAKQEIDAISFSAAAAGKDVRNMSGVALRSREAAAQTELAPMFDVLRHLDVRVYRKIWNRIRQYWKAEKWIRVTDDEHTLQWVGLNKPVTKGEQILKQAQEQGAPPEALQQLQQQIAQDPSMQQVVQTENQLAELDVDIIIKDAPDAITTQAEDFTVLGEMVKSGFQIPPIAVIEASPLSNKDKIIKMMQAQPQVPPQIQQQMDQMKEQGQKMQEEMQKLAQENQQLKSGAQEAQAKIQLEAQVTQMKLQAAQQESQAKLAAREQEVQAELALQKMKQDGDISLAREKAMGELALKREIAAAELELEQQRMALNADAEIDKAITKVKSMADMHMAANTKEDESAAVEKGEAGQTQFLAGINQIVGTLQQKKRVSITMPDGRTAEAEVTLQ